MKLRRDTTSNLIVVAVLTLVIFSIVSYILPRMEPRTIVRIGDGVFRTRVVTSDDEMSRGLSGSAKLATNEGMLFVFNEDAKWSMWMKDMEFSIDIIWLDADKEVVYIVKNAHPETYPQTKFIPETDARYVFEVLAGTVDSKGIRIGSEADFRLEPKRGYER